MQSTVTVTLGGFGVCPNCQAADRWQLRRGGHHQVVWIVCACNPALPWGLVEDDGTVRNYGALKK